MGIRSALLCLASLIIVSRLSADRVEVTHQRTGRRVLHGRLRVDSLLSQATSVDSLPEQPTGNHSPSEQPAKNENDLGDFRISGFHWFLIFVALTSMAAVMACVMACSKCMVNSVPGLRQIPISAGFAFVLSWVGFAMSTAARSKVDSAMDHMGFQGFDAILDFLTLSFTIMICVNMAALILAFVAAGCFREFLFRQRATDFPCLLRTGQCMLGPFAVMTLRILLWLSFALQLFLSYIFLLVGIIIVCVAGICHGGAIAVQHAETVLADLHGTGLHMKGHCDSITNISSAKFLLFAGCIVTVFSQAGMLSALATEQAQIEEEMKKMTPLDVDDCLPAVDFSQT